MLCLCSVSEFPFVKFPQSTARVIGSTTVHSVGAVMTTRGLNERPTNETGEAVYKYNTYKQTEQTKKRRKQNTTTDEANWDMITLR